MAVSCKAVDMHKDLHVTACYRAVPFSTPHARSSLKFGHERGNKRNCILISLSVIGGGGGTPGLIFLIKWGPLQYNFSKILQSNIPSVYF